MKVQKRSGKSRDKKKRRKGCTDAEITHDRINTEVKNHPRRGTTFQSITVTLELQNVLIYGLNNIV